MSESSPLARVIAHWTARNPDLLSRLAKARQIVAAGGISWDHEARAHVVPSQSNPLGGYERTAIGIT